MEGIELVSSGYEFICPKCNELNIFEEAYEKAQCWNCETEYEVTNIVNP